MIQFDPTRALFADVNHWHPLIDGAAYAAAATAPALGFKVTQAMYVDPTASHHLKAAEANGLVCLGFEYGMTSVGAFIAAFPPAPGRIPVLDFEGASVSVADAETWIKAVRDAWDRYPWFYGHNEWLAAGAPSDTEIKNCPYWGARYGGPLVVPNGVGKPVAFQFTDGASGPFPHTIAGVGSNCDVNMLIVEVDELRALAGLGDEGAGR